MLLMPAPPPESLRQAKQPVPGSPDPALYPCSVAWVLNTDMFCNVPEVWESKARSTNQEDGGCLWWSQKPH